MKNFTKVIFIIAVAVSAFFYRDTIKNVWTQAFNSYFPCRQPITYSLDAFDTRFGISKADFLASVSSAEAIWGRAVGKNLFQYAPGGNLKINLVYDSRQQSTSQLQKMGIVVENNRASYDSLKLKYTDLVSSYEENKKIFESRLSLFEARKNAYESEVTSGNKRGGVNQDALNRLNAEREYLNQEIIALNALQSDLNSQIDNINALAIALNQLAKTLNINVGQYNTIGNSLGGEFEEGTYTSDASGQRIDIYQFDNKAKLIRVLAHELGHALGLNHVEDPKAIMYRLNNGVNEKLTESDLAQIKKICGPSN